MPIHLQEYSGNMTRNIPAMLHDITLGVGLAWIEIALTFIAIGVWRIADKK